MPKAKIEHVTRLVDVWDITRKDGRVFRVERHEYVVNAPYYVVCYAVKAFELVKGIWTVAKNFPELPEHCPHTQIQDFAINAIQELK